jgi:murein DD-endopeptidase MepM/ murein hydrolase activator NlpD
MDVMRKSFVITAARDSNGKTFRFTIGAHALIVVALLFVGFPALFFAGTSWGATAVIADLLRQNAALQAENASYRDATAQLAGQVSTLQAAADTLRAAAQLDPQAAQAMNRLPASITHRAMGGGALNDLASPVSSTVTAGDPAFGLLRDVLHILQTQLDRFRSGAERRQALAAATPSIWPVTGGLSSQYGTRSDPFTGSSDFHAGLDISAGSGQPVRATADGTVTNARWNGSFGNLVVLDHGFGITTRYGHLSRFAVSEGQQIRKGDVVGYVGSTGRSTSPHVHYELLLNGRATNPLRLLAR